MNYPLREPVNALTHLFGAALSVVAMIMMFVKITLAHALTPPYIVSVTAFSLGLIALYLTSGLYHSVHTTPEKLVVWKKMDHTMIFLLIAGSYTPFCLLGLHSRAGTILLAAVWTVAVIGGLMMIFWINMPRWLNTALYIVLGWFVVLCVGPLYRSLPAPAFWLLVSGGVFYTIGGIIYGIKKPNISKNFGFHELFHIFCLLGSLCQFLSVYCYLLP